MNLRNPIPLPWTRESEPRKSFDKYERQINLENPLRQKNPKNKREAVLFGKSCEMSYARELPLPIPREYLQYSGLPSVQN
jgi:hypothetical protein